MEWLGNFISIISQWCHIGLNKEGMCYLNSIVRLQTKSLELKKTGPIRVCLLNFSCVAKMFHCALNFTLGFIFFPKATILFLTRTWRLGEESPSGLQKLTYLPSNTVIRIKLFTYFNKYQLSSWKRGN